MATILGIDPGTKHIGWAVINTNTQSVVMSGTIDATKFGPASLDEWLTNVDVVAVEMPRPGRAAAVKPLMETACLAGRIRGWCDILFLGHQTFMSFSSYAWRKALCGDSNASNAAIKDALNDEHTGVRNMPKRSNNHERDAIGIARFAALQGCHVA